MLANLFDDCDLLRSRTCHERSFDDISRLEVGTTAPRDRDMQDVRSAQHFASSGGSTTL
jgi:hypothetical protein